MHQSVKAKSLLHRSSVLLLVTILAATVLVGCGGQTSAQPTPTAAPTADTQETQAVTPPETTDEVFHYVLCPGFSAPPSNEPEMKAYWEEKLGATFDLVYLENAQYMELLNLRIASGNIPDVMSLQSIANVVKYKDDGIIGGFSRDFLQEASPTTYSFIQDKLGEEGFGFVTYDGLMYSLPGGRHHNQFTAPVIWNTTWLEQVGITEIPKTLEETEAALYAFRNDDPDGNGQKDTYGLSVDGFNAIMGAFGVQYTAMWQDDGTGQLAYGVANPKAKEGLALLAKWYSDGIIDPEFVTGENKGGYWANSNAFCEGRIGFTGKAAYYHWRPQDIVEKGLPLIGNAELINTVNPDMQYEFGYPPVGSNGESGTTRGNFLYALVGFSNDLVQNEAKLAKFLQMTETWCGLENVEDAITQTFGIKGTHWDYDESNTPVQKPDFSSIEAISAFGGNTTFQFYENPDVQAALAPVQYEWASALYAEPGRNTYYENAIPVPLPSDAEYLAEAQKVLDEGCIAIITGDKPIDYFEEMVEQFNKAGGDILTKEANEWYSAR